MTSAQPITDTGIQGFLKWLQSPQGQPAIYAKIAPELPRKAPQLFSEFEANGGLGAYQMRTLEGLGQTDTLAPVNVTAQLMPQVDVADAANTTPTDPSSTSWLSSLINGVSSAYLTYNQAQQQNSIINAQLQRAQQGLPPLNISTGSYGVPTISTSLLSNPAVLIGGGLLLFGGLYLMMKRRR